MDMRKKKILVDLSILKNIYCGLGQVALNYGRYFAENYTGNEEYELYLLMPKKMFGLFGNKVKYVPSNKINKHFPCFMSKYDVWHSIHQLSRFKSAYKDTKVILTIHDFNFIYEKQNNPKKAARYLKKIQLKINRADKIICISEFAKKETKKYTDLHGKNIQVIHNGVEKLDGEKTRKPDFIKNEKPFFFTIGQIKEKKNFHVLLPLMKLFPNKELYIAGQTGTSYTDLIKNTIETENIANVHLVGTVNNEERIWLYKNCEAFVFPSLFEGFGLPVIEAMYFGKPVFSSKETSLKEIGGNRAFFWDDFNPESMKKVINENLDQFYSSPNEARKNIEYAESFSYKKHMEQYLNVYMKLIRN